MCLNLEGHGKQKLTAEIELHSSEKYHLIATAAINMMFASASECNIYFSFCIGLPKISLQLFLLNQHGHDGSYQDLVGDGSNHKVAKDAYKSNPAGTAAPKG